MSGEQDNGAATSAAEAAEPPASRCRVCKKPMPAGAVKCTECNSYQDWRRFVFSTTGLIGALLGVAVAGITVFTFFFPDEPDPPRLRVAFERCLPDRITILVSNDGGRTATVGAPSFTLHESGVSSRIDMTGLFDVHPFTDDDREIEAGETDEQTYPNDVSDFFSAPARDCRIDVRIPVLDGGAGEPELRRRCPCGFELS